MPLKLDGTYGVSGVVGTASSAAVYGADADSGIVFSGNQTLINSDGSTIATVGASGINVTGIVTSTTLRTTSIVGVTTAGITTVYTNSVNGGQLGGSRNIIINGSMVVNQRGFTGAAGTTTDGSFPADRFRLSQNNSAAVSAGQTSMNSTVGGNAYADGFQNALILRVTTAQSSLSAGNFQLVQQNIEGYNLQGIKKGTTNAQPITLSFWVRSNTIGTYIVDIHDNDNTRSCSQSYSINVANTWEKKVLTFPADTTGVFDNDNNLSAYLNWWLAGGTTWTSGTLQTSWAALTNANRAVGQTNLLATVNNEFWLTGVQLEVGDRATEFERRSYGQELLLCYRYYQKSTTNENYLLPIGSATQIHRQKVTFVVPMRTTANVTRTKVAGDATIGDDGSNFDGFRSGFGGNQYQNIDYSWTASAEL